mgnify:CR=1 FL=1
MNLLFIIILLIIGLFILNKNTEGYKTVTSNLTQHKTYKTKPFWYYGQWNQDSPFIYKHGIYPNLYTYPYFYRPFNFRNLNYYGNWTKKLPTLKYINE